ncbi:hypothetical protein BDA96_09G221400 [Sorghum bicolor]|uniref:Uncharacterized protein n=1 Tax=Sorghum bicolor TaxID=4558 RepID=A0A921QEG9_SORBI|nr:hypothetical protein BDA96_09G221400 [Sorghum bicolor]
MTFTDNSSADPYHNPNSKSNQNTAQITAPPLLLSCSPRAVAQYCNSPIPTSLPPVARGLQWKQRHKGKSPGVPARQTCTRGGQLQVLPQEAAAAGTHRRQATVGRDQQWRL